MSKKNICPNDDPFNRYKRDVLTITHERKHGGQTKITNLGEIAKQLHVEEKAITSYFSKRLKMPVHKAVLRGTLEVSVLESVLDSFIAEFVLCANCGLPELKDGVCKACGETWVAKS